MIKRKLSIKSMEIKVIYFFMHFKQIYSFVNKTLKGCYFQDAFITQEIPTIIWNKRFHVENKMRYAVDVGP